jgi:ABC-type Mn2+/Zn2+ transport system permease subunit
MARGMNLNGLLLSISMAAAAGLVGCFAVMRRMTLAADALSHVALPGIGIALVLRIHPVAGGALMLVLGAILVWELQERTQLATETVTGVVFSAALAAGSMLATGDELIEALFGSPGNIGNLELGLGIAAAACVIVFILVTKERLVLILVSPQIAHTSGIRVSRTNLMYLLAFAVTIALGLRYLGVLLMGSLVIIPAATARRLARSLTGMFATAVALSVLSTVVGTYLALRLGQPTGALIVTVAAGFFALGLFRRTEI